MAKRVIVSVGTKRGLFLLESGRGRNRWKITGPLLKGWSVPYAFIDTRGAPRLHAAASSYTYGATTLSADLKKHRFQPAKQPPAFPKLNPKAAKFVKQYGLDASNRIWSIAAGPARQKSVLYAGTAPAGLFRSDDKGKSWEPVDGLNRHRVFGRRELIVRPAEAGRDCRFRYTGRSLVVEARGSADVSPAEAERAEVGPRS